jgi:hypothetical protein
LGEGALDKWKFSGDTRPKKSLVETKAPSKPVSKFYNFLGMYRGRKKI